MDISLAAHRFFSLAQPHRLAVYKRLVRGGKTGLPAGDLSIALGIPHNTMSAHLAVLVGAQLATRSRQGRHVRYALDVEGSRDVLRFLVLDCCEGRADLCLPGRRVGEAERAAAPGMLAALGNETRLSVVRLIIGAGEDGVRAGAISETLAMRSSALSAHLKTLHTAGLVQRTRRSRTILYSPDTHGIRVLTSFLFSDCCNDRPDLCSPLHDCREFDIPNSTNERTPA